MNNEVYVVALGPSVYLLPGKLQCIHLRATPITESVDVYKLGV